MAAATASQRCAMNVPPARPRRRSSRPSWPIVSSALRTVISLTPSACEITPASVSRSPGERPPRRTSRAILERTSSAPDKPPKTWRLLDPAWRVGTRSRDGSPTTYAPNLPACPATRTPYAAAPRSRIFEMPLEARGIGITDNSGSPGAREFSRSDPLWDAAPILPRRRVVPTALGRPVRQPEHHLLGRVPSTALMSRTPKNQPWATAGYQGGLGDKNAAAAQPTSLEVIHGVVDCVQRVGVREHRDVSGGIKRHKLDEVVVTAHEVTDDVALG